MLSKPKCQAPDRRDFELTNVIFSQRLDEGEALDDILPEVFARGARGRPRALGQRHFDVQLMGGIVLHQGKIAEMNTGEGKTLTATTAVALNAITGRGVHVITVNDYLAKRDTQWMGHVYNALGLSVGCIQHDEAFIFDPDWESPDPRLEYSAAGRAPRSLCRRHHLWHEQRVRIRLSARQHGRFSANSRSSAN